jgi:hypothetical protein
MMNKSQRIVTTSVIALLAASTAIAADLRPAKNKELSYVLNNFEIMTESGKGDELSIRLMKVQDQGECDGSPQSCPKSAVYAAVSELGEYPEQKLYQLPKMHNWRFVRWIKQAKSASETAEIELAVDLPSKNPQKEWWVEKHYMLRLGLGVAKLSEL